jgi:hypothetical protein
LKSVDLPTLDALVSFDISLFTNAPVDEALQIMSNELHNNDTLAERSALQAEAIIELLEACLRTTYFQVVIRSSNRKMVWLWAALCHQSLAKCTWNILRNLRVTRHNKSSPWLRYIDDTFLILPHGLEQLTEFPQPP